jgi:hypothetical protein
MSAYVDRIVANLREAEDALSEDVHEQQRRWRYRVRRGRVWFDAEVRRAHKQFKQSIPAFLSRASVLNLLTTPIVYSLGVPLLLLDVWATAYQWMCFPIYGIARVQRRSYFVVDRHRLGYLNLIEKANCMYCSYATGVVAYVREIGARTEQYWCPIKHSRRVPAPHSRYQLFFDYGDAAGYRHGLLRVRKVLARPRSQPVSATRARDSALSSPRNDGRSAGAPIRSTR